jgi:DNA-binding XRE family transcriptional regulator
MPVGGRGLSCLVQARWFRSRLDRAGGGRSGRLIASVFLRRRLLLVTTTPTRSRVRSGSAEQTVVSKRPETVIRALGRRIRRLRTERGWSQEYLADEAGMHRTYMWGIEQGVRNPSVRHLVRIADALGVPVKTLFGDD